MLLHVGAFHLDIDSKQLTPWHSLTPQTRLLCTLLIVWFRRTGRYRGESRDVASAAEANCR